MEFTLLSYNVLNNKAYLKFESLIGKYKPDIICLQEVETSQNNLHKLESFGYKLADYANSFMNFGTIFGVATYYNPDKIKLIKSNSIDLSLSISEIFFTIIQLIFGQKKPKTVLKTDFLNKTNNNKLTVCNAHLMLVATNAIRLKVIKQALESVSLKSKASLIMCGDFNYFPYSRKRLEKMMSEFGLTEATKNIVHSIKFSKDGKYEQYNFIQRLAAKLINRSRIAKNNKPDYVFYKNLSLIKSLRLNVRFSDHFPIITTFKI